MRELRKVTSATLIVKTSYFKIMLILSNTVYNAFFEESTSCMFGNRIRQKKCWIVGIREKKLVAITGLKNPMGDPHGDKNPMHLFFEKLASIL